MGSRTQFSGFSALRQGGTGTLLDQQAVDSLFNRYAPKDTITEPPSLSNELIQETALISHQDPTTATTNPTLSDSEIFDTNAVAPFDKFKTQDDIAEKWTHLGSRFDTPEMHLSRVAPLDYCDDEKLLFQVIETLPEKKMRYLIHQICRDQATAFRWFSRECLDMDCEWPLKKLRVGLRHSMADEFEDAWWHNEFWERRTKGNAEGGEGMIRSPWIIDPSLPNPCPTCVPQVQEEIEIMQGKGKAHGKGKASASLPEASDLEHETFTCHQCGEEITLQNRAEACVFHPPSAFQRYQPSDDIEETIEEAIQRQDRDAALERLGVYEQESWGLSWSCCGESELSAGCERGRHAPERALQYNDDMFYRKKSPMGRKMLGRFVSESPETRRGNAHDGSERGRSECGSMRCYESSPEREGEEKDSATSVVTAIRDEVEESSGTADEKVAED